MPTTTSITTTYAGEFAGKYVKAALLNAPTIANGLIEVKPNVKFRSVLKRFATGNLLANATCDFTDTSSVTLTERILQPKELQVNLKLCKQDFQSDWEAVQMGYSAFDQLPPTFADFLIASLAEKVAAENEVSIWRGVNGAGTFDGFSTLLSLDAALPAAQEIAGIGGGVNASNVIAELGKVHLAIPDTLYGRDDLAIYVAQNVYRAYVIALGGFGANGLGANGFEGKGTNQAFGDLMFGGVKIVIANGLAANTMIATYKENLYFGTGLLSDHNEVKVIDMADIDGSQNVRFVMRMTGAVQYSIVEDIVTYGIVNAAN
jgi:hypothetical protein